MRRALGFLLLSPIIGAGLFVATDVASHLGAAEAIFLGVVFAWVAGALTLIALD